MPKIFIRLSALIAILCLIIFALLSCTPQVTTAPETTITVPPTASATKEFIPAIPKNVEKLVIFSFEEDGYAHLFAYIPNKLPLTRITAGDWDDVSPAPSSDGERIAFVSNHSGFWNLNGCHHSTHRYTRL
jgi:hypothetical protein